MTQSSAATLPVGQWKSSSPAETYELGRKIGGALHGGEIILLQGPLGAGKTLLVKGIAEALEVPEEEVTSPSFTLVNLYKGRLTLYHVDLYRLDEGASAAHAVDLDELLTDETAVIIVEWAERMGSYRLPSPVWRINIEGYGDETRTIVIQRI